MCRLTGAEISQESGIATFRGRMDSGHPNIVVDSEIQTINEAQRFPLTGTIDQAGNDIQRIKQMGIDHIIFGYNFIPVGRNLEKMMDITRRLSKFAVGVCAR